MLFDFSHGMKVLKSPTIIYSFFCLHILPPDALKPTYWHLATTTDLPISQTCTSPTNILFSLQILKIPNYMFWYNQVQNMYFFVWTDQEKSGEKACFHSFQKQNFLIYMWYVSTVDQSDEPPTNTNANQFLLNFQASMTYCKCTP